MAIAENVAAIRSAMESAARDAGRDPKEIKLCAATKMNDAEAVRQAIAAGVDCCGENRVQEAKEKRTIVPDRGFWHLIGHLQTNKARQAVTLFDLIESADSEHLLAALDKAAGQQHKQQDILLQLNIAREEQKTGFLIEDYLHFSDIS